MIVVWKRKIFFFFFFLDSFSFFSYSFLLSFFHSIFVSLISSSQKKRALFRLLKSCISLSHSHYFKPRFFRDLQTSHFQTQGVRKRKKDDWIHSIFKKCKSSVFSPFQAFFSLFQSPRPISGFFPEGFLFLSSLSLSAITFLSLSLSSHLLPLSSFEGLQFWSPQDFNSCSLWLIFCHVSVN